MIYRAYQKAIGVKKDAQQDWEDEEMMPEERKVFYPWEDTSYAWTSEPAGKKVREFIPRAPEDSETLAKSIEQRQADQLPQKPPAKMVPVQNEPGQFLPQLDSHNLINGIILSELLQPPKCKRPRPKI